MFLSQLKFVSGSHTDCGEAIFIQEQIIYFQIAQSRAISQFLSTFVRLLLDYGDRAGQREAQLLYSVSKLELGSGF